MMIARRPFLIALVIIGTVFVSCFDAAGQFVPTSKNSNLSRNNAPGPELKIHQSLNALFRQRASGARMKAWVFFESTKSLPSPLARNVAIRNAQGLFTNRAIQRRTLRRTKPDLFDTHDVPVPPNYIDAVRSTGAEVRVVSRWLNGVSVLATQQQIRTIAALPSVTHIQPVRRGRRILPPNPANPNKLADTHLKLQAALGFYGEAEAQLAQIKLTDLHTAGFTGAGVRVAILDTGFQRSHEAFNEPGHVLNVIAEYDFINKDADTSIEVGDASSQHNHGTWILGTLGAYKPNLLVGGAYDAEFILCKTEDTTAEYPAEEDNYVAGLEFAELNGADLVSASLGYIDWYTQSDLDGLTAVTTIAVNIATVNGMHCLNAAGNGGHDTDPATSRLIAPADAMQVITVGAVDDTGTIASFSSDGPTADGRTKPEVLAWGVNTRTVSASSDTTYSGLNGTSLSTPLAAGVVACLVQAHPNWTVEQMRWYLMHTASDYVATGSFDPEFVRGYGILDALAATAGDCDGNGIEDVTDIANATLADCNTNLIPDVCEITADATLDQNLNGMIDTCEVAIPTTSTWGLIVLTLLVASVGSTVFRRQLSAIS